LKIQVLGIGKIREPYFREAVEEYTRRIGHYVPIRVRDAAKELSASEHDLEAAYNRLRKEHHKADLKVALDKKGRTMSSEDLAAWLGKAMLNSVGLISFIIGGPHGLALSALTESDQTLSLGAMTFPHQMARLLLLEQVYRALTILRGEPYHK
jgi:23S rRNA (pseudouridine1915-N3)-methyltransferase